MPRRERALEIVKTGSFAAKSRALNSPADRAALTTVGGPAGAPIATTLALGAAGATTGGCAESIEAVRKRVTDLIVTAITGSVPRAGDSNLRASQQLGSVSVSPPDSLLQDPRPLQALFEPELGIGQDGPVGYHNGRHEFWSHVGGMPVTCEQHGYPWEGERFVIVWDSCLFVEPINDDYDYPTGPTRTKVFIGVRGEWPSGLDKANPFGVLACSEGEERFQRRMGSTANWRFLVEAVNDHLAVLADGLTASPGTGPMLCEAEAVEQGCRERLRQAEARQRVIRNLMMMRS